MLIDCAYPGLNLIVLYQLHLVLGISLLKKFLSDLFLAPAFHFLGVVDDSAGDPPPSGYCTSIVLIVHHGDD